MGVVQAIKLMRSFATNAKPALPEAQIAVNLTDKILFVGVDGTKNNLIKFVDVGGVESMMSAYLPKTGGTIGGHLTVEGDLIVNGNTVTANVETITVEDPIITLGGTSIPTVNDGKDRGIEFHWYDDDDGAKKGFFGFDRSEQKFTFIPDAVNTNEVFSGDVGTILANLEGNASTATKVNKAVTFNNSGSGDSGVGSGISFDGSTARTISYNTIGAAALAGSAGQDFSTKDLSVLGNLGVSGTTTLAGGVGITSGALTLSGKSTMLTPYIDFFSYNDEDSELYTTHSRIIETATKELSIYGGVEANGSAAADGKIKLKSDTYVEKALYIGGSSGAKIVFVAASGGVPAYLKLQNYDGGVMHFVTTGGQTMYSAGVPAGGGGGGASVILNGETTEYPRFWAPTDQGTVDGQYIKWNDTTGIPEWGTLPTVTKVQIEDVLTGTIDSHDHTFASLKGKPNTLVGYGIGDAVHISHEGAGAGAHAVANANLNGFMSAIDKKNLDNLYSNLVIYNAGQAEGRTLELASALIPAYFYHKRNVMLMYGDDNEQHVYIWIATTNLIEGNKDKPENWLRISKPDVDGGTY